MKVGLTDGNMSINEQIARAILSDHGIASTFVAVDNSGSEPCQV